MYSHHGTFYYNQLAALKLLLGDVSGAQNATQTYFSTLFMDQIDGSGEQARAIRVNFPVFLADPTRT